MVCGNKYLSFDEPKKKKYIYMRDSIYLFLYGCHNINTPKIKIK